MNKYIISNGCSYTIYLQHFKSMLASDSYYKKNNVHFVNLGSNGAANNHIADTTIHAVSKLLNSGVLSEDIFVLVDYTQIGRLSKRLPSNFEDDFNTSVTKFKDESKLVATIETIDRRLQISRCNGWVKIDNTIYSLMQNLTDKYFPKYFKEWDELVRFSYRTYIDTIEEYFNSIILLQTYLKFVGVEHRSFFMNNVVEGWYYGNRGGNPPRFRIPWISDKFLKSEETLTHSYTTETDYKVPDLSDTLHVRQLSPILNATFDVIDFSKFILYKTEGNNFGGIDEYVIDNFPREYFINATDGQGHGCTGPVFGMHPTSKAHIQYIDAFLLDTIKKFLRSDYE